MTSIGVDPAPGGLPDGTPEKTAAELTLQLARAERRQARKEQWRLLRRRPGFIIGCLILLFWIVCAIGGDRITPFDPINDLAIPFQSPGGEPLVRDGRPRPGRALPGDGRRSGRAHRGLHRRRRWPRSWAPCSG